MPRRKGVAARLDKRQKRREVTSTNGGVPISRGCLFVFRKELGVNLHLEGGGGLVGGSAKRLVHLA
jgi:hypothetical protein